MIEELNNDQLEAAAVAAEQWSEHGAIPCQHNWLNQDGFS